MGLIEVNDSEFPFVCARVAGDVTDEEYASWREQIDLVAANATQRYVTVIDATGALVPTGQQFRFLTNWLREAPHNHNLMVIAYVIPSPGVRLALKAIFAIQALLIPHEVVGTYAEARNLALRYLARDNAAV